MTTGSRRSLGELSSSLGELNEPDPKGNDRVLERSYRNGETRRSSVQIRPAPPKTSCGKMANFFELPFLKLVKRSLVRFPLPEVFCCGFSHFSNKDQKWSNLKRRRIQ